MIETRTFEWEHVMYHLNHNRFYVKLYNQSFILKKKKIIAYIFFIIDATV